jgi:hypothetical protein
LKIERKHAKKLATYLEDDMGWEVFPPKRMECPRCHRTYFKGDKFCKSDGSKLKENGEREDTLGLIVKGMKLALGEK